eukprot:14721789-Alexandrium_andersonii.AAC.1
MVLWVAAGAPADRASPSPPRHCSCGSKGRPQQITTRPGTGPDIPGARCACDRAQSSRSCSRPRADGAAV